MRDSVFSEILSYASVLFLLASIVAFKKWYDLSQEQKLKSLVAWSVTGDHCPALGRYSYTTELLFAITAAQAKLNIPKEYCLISQTERNFCLEIIAEYQKQMARDYFQGNLHPIKSKYVVMEKDYFMATLLAFLSDHQCDNKFIGYEMHKERINYCLHGVWGGTLFDATYALTDFAIVFFKMNYITYMYCKNSPITNPSGSTQWRDWEEKSLNAILETKQIEVSRC
jgi:hypothetical protein